MLRDGLVCIGGLPWIGSVGKVAADYLSVALDTSPVQTFRSSGFPPQVMVVEGLARPFSVEIKAPGERHDLLILSGDAQPLEVKGMYALAGDILQKAKSLHATKIISLGAYVGEANEKILGVASDPKLASFLKDSGIPLLKNGFIGGVNGILCGLAPLYGMQGACLMGATKGDMLIDLKAAGNLLMAVSKLLSIDISTDELADIFEEALPDEQEDMNYV